MRVLIKKEFFIRKAYLPDEYLEDVKITSELVRVLRDQADLLTYAERTFLENNNPAPVYGALRDTDDVALLRFHSYEEWWQRIGKKTRNMIRKAEKSGVEVKIVNEVNDSLTKEIWRIYNETPIRQGRYFPHYGISYEEVKRGLMEMVNSDLFCAFWKGQVIGFSILKYGDRVAQISQILSLTKHFDKAPNNALIAKMVERSAQLNIYNIIYARMGKFHETLTQFKKHHGFITYCLPRYYLPLTRRGNVAIKLKFYKPLKDIVPEAIGRPLLPLFNLLSCKLRLSL